jgi:hypothetical protein
MKEDLKQQERDFHRALECKMQEQKDLLEKGHKEKADLMRQEMIWRSSRIATNLRRKDVVALSLKSCLFFDLDWMLPTLSFNIRS